MVVRAWPQGLDRQADLGLQPGTCSLQRRLCASISPHSPEARHEFFLYFLSTSCLPEMQFVSRVRAGGLGRPLRWHPQEGIQRAQRAGGKTENRQGGKEARGNDGSRQGGDPDSTATTSPTSWVVVSQASSSTLPASLTTSKHGSPPTSVQAMIPSHTHAVLSASVHVFFYPEHTSPPPCASHCLPATAHTHLCSYSPLLNLRSRWCWGSFTPATAQSLLAANICDSEGFLGMGAMAAAPMAMMAGGGGEKRQLPKPELSPTPSQCVVGTGF